MDNVKPSNTNAVDAADEAPQPLGLGLRWSDPDSPLANYYLRPGHVAAAFLIAAAFVLYSWTPLWHTDLWGHLAFGRWIVENQALPRAEPFTPHGARTQPIGHFNWLSQVAGYLVFRAGEALAGEELRFQAGVEAVRAAFAFATTLLLLLLLRAFLRRAGSPWLAVAALGIVLLLSFSVFSVQRPQVIGLVLFAALLGALTPAILSRRSMFVVPLLFVLWANAHGSYIMGLMLLGVFLAGRVIEVFADSGGPRAILKDGQVRRLAGVLVLSVLGVLLLNPHGPALLQLTSALSRHPNIRQLEEWSPLSFTWGPGGQWGYVASLVVVLASQLVSRRALSPTSLLLVATFGVLPCVQQRMMVWWTLLWPWVVLPLWAETSSRLFRRAKPSMPRRNLICTLLVCVVAAVGAFLSPAAQGVLSGKPRMTVEQALSAGTPLRLGAGWEVRGRVFCSETQGDFLIWRARPGMEVLVYTHAHLFPPEHWDRCMATKFGEPGWRENLDRWQANLVVIEPRLHPRIADLLRRDRDWEVTLDEANDQRIRDPRGALFVARRKKPW